MEILINLCVQWDSNPAYPSFRQTSLSIFNDFISQKRELDDLNIQSTEGIYTDLMDYLIS